MNFQEADYIAKNFRFSSGAVLPELKLHYRTLGAVSYSEAGEIDNAVLMLHGTTGSGQQFTDAETTDFLFKPGQPLDPAKYFIILPDAIGHGGSSKPSDGLGSNFPPYTYHDIVAAQHAVVTEALKVKRLRLLLGTSMGGMQTWMWGEAYPDMMRALMPIACFPEKVKGRNLLWRRMLIQILRTDPTYQGGTYEKQPRNLGIAYSLFSLMVDSPLHLQQEVCAVPDADRTVLARFRTALAAQDANDVVFEFDASHDYDPAPGIGKVKAPLLTVNFADDELNPHELGIADEAVKKLQRARSVLVPVGPKTRGHQTLRVPEVWAKYVGEILRETETGA